LNNILVGADGLAKLSDFGMSAIRSCATLSKGAELTLGGLRWQAPEGLTKRPTVASDVYSLAVCMIEAVISEPPWAFLDDATVRENLKAGIRPERPDEMNDFKWNLVSDMTHVNPDERLPLHRVIAKMAEIQEAYGPALTGESAPDRNADNAAQAHLAECLEKLEMKAEAVDSLLETVEELTKRLKEKDLEIEELSEQRAKLEKYTKKMLDSVQTK
jgi:serine/threonine protein kinase